jgi:hypothetical protein
LVFLGNKLSLNTKFSDYRKSRLQRSSNSLESIYQTTFSQLDHKIPEDQKAPTAILVPQGLVNAKDKSVNPILHSEFEQIEEEWEEVKEL